MYNGLGKLQDSKLKSTFNLFVSVGKDWKLGSELGWEAAKLDWSILRKLQKRFDEIKDITCKFFILTSMRMSFGKPELRILYIRISKFLCQINIFYFHSFIKR